MSLPDQTPKLPKLPFLIGDVALLGAAWYLVYRDTGPLESNTIIAVTVCVGVASILGAVPFLTDYARKQDEALDERQRGLEALSRTINSAAEQISIAANGLNELTDLTHKNLKHAEQLPHKLQDKIAEFNAQLDNAREDDREELEKELVELRTSETERLQATSEKVHKAIQELTRLEAAVQQHSGNRTADVERAQKAAGDVYASANAALAEAFTGLARNLADTQAKALAEIERTLSQRTTAAVDAIEAAVQHATASVATASVKHPPVEPIANETPAAQSNSEPVSEVASPPKRPRKARREETPAPDSISSDQSQEPGSQPPSDAPTPESSPAEPAASAPLPPEPGLPPFLEPAPIPTEAIVHIQPVAPLSAEPFPAKTLPPESTPPSEPVAASPEEKSAPATDERAMRKRAPRKANSDPNGDLQFELGSDDPSMTSSGQVERVLSSDGATRLIVTAYIGIGNRLFIRGDGPGLDWDRGVPLQFISIGKWRWETAESTTPMSFKLYKNDDVECPGLGALTLDPGYQQEVTAKF